MLKVNINFKCYILFLSSKNNKKQARSAWNYQGFISLRNFRWILFETCISHHGSEKIQIYGKLQLLEDILARQNIEFRYFYLYIYTYTTQPPSPFRPCSLRRRGLGILGYFIWFVIFSNAMTVLYCFIAITIFYFNVFLTLPLQPQSDTKVIRDKKLHYDWMKFITA